MVKRKYLALFSHFSNIFFLFLQTSKIIMNGFVSAIVLACVAASANAIFSTTTGTFVLGPITELTGGGLSITAGSATALLTNAGVLAGALGLLGAAIVVGAIGGGSLLPELPLRNRRSAPVDALAAVDKYFEQISDMDVDDCGKLLVCQLETVATEVSIFIFRKVGKLESFGVFLEKLGKLCES